MNDGLISEYSETITEEGLRNSSAKLYPKGTLVLALYGATVGKVGIVNFDTVSNQAVCAVFPTEEVDKRYLFWFLRQKRLDFLRMSFGGAQPNISQAVVRNTSLPVPPLGVQKQVVAILDEYELSKNLLETEVVTEIRGNLHTYNIIKTGYDKIVENNSTNSELCQKLRQSILLEAVSGKLVPQDPKDEPASELLKKIKVEKEKLVREKKIKEMELQPISKEEIPLELPKSWEWVRFGQITICRDGERVPVSEDERKLKEKIYDYYGASGIIDKIDSYLFDKELLLIGEDGANLVNRSTPIAFLAKGKYWVNNHAHVLDSIDLDILRFLEVYINAIDLRPYVTGTAQPKMNQSKMNSILVAFPPLAEQMRIIKKVEAIMNLCDELEQKVKENQKSSEYLLEAVLKEALAS